MESLTDCGYSGIDNGTKACHFLQGIKSTELEAVVNIVQAQLEKYGTDFDATVPYLVQLVMEKSTSMQSVHIVRTRNQPVKRKVVAFMGIIECKNYPKAVWNSMTKEQQMHIKKLQEQQGIKPTAK